MSPFWFILYLLIDLNIEAIISVDVVWACLSEIEVGERSVIIGVSGVVSPLWLIFDFSFCLNIKAIIVIHIVWAGLSTVKVISRAIVV